jgi:hypothetical protein
MAWIELAVLFKIVITNEARNLLFFYLLAIRGEKQIPHGLKAVRNDNSRVCG